MMWNVPDNFRGVIQPFKALKSKGEVFTDVYTVYHKTKCESLLQFILTLGVITVLKTRSKKPLTSRQGNQNFQNANLCPGFTTLLVLREQGEALKGSRPLPTIVWRK